MNLYKQYYVKFAIKYQRQNWNQIIFSDETIFQMFQNTQKVFYKASTQFSQKLIIKYLYKVHVWDAFLSKG